jgi:ferritin-like metal-binding protein YciE
MPDKITQPKELFLHELGDILYAENKIAKVLPDMREQATDEKVRDRIGEHLEETRAQIDNLKQVFEALGEKVEAEQCPSIDGLAEEYEELKDEVEGDSDVRDLALLGSAARTEHYEIAAYEGLITMAKAMSEDKVVKLLEANLEQEKAMLRDAKAETRKISRRAVKAAA